MLMVLSFDGVQVVSGLKMKSDDNADPVLSELSKGSDTVETLPTSDDELQSRLV